MKKLALEILIVVTMLAAIPATAAPGRNVSSLDGVGLPYMVRQDIPGVADVIVYPVNYKETHPIEWGKFDTQHYFKYAEVQYWLDRWAKEYPNLVDVYSVGKSFEGREIWQITITNKVTGPDTQKPAMWVGGNRHAGEVTAAVAAMDFAHTLLTNYGKDPEITRLVDTCAFYVRPNENPDGSELYLNTSQTLRSTVRPVDSDGDGVADNDIAQDLDGNGLITEMRQYVGPGKGTHIKDPTDPSGRLMKSVGAGKGDYLIYSEGVDCNGDGRINSDGIGGLDLHRNYTHAWRPMEEATGMGWTQGGAGEYPLSEPEMRAVFLFLVTHPNVSVAQTMDTAVPMHLRPPSTSRSEESMFPSDLAYYKYFDTEGKKLTKYPWAGDVYHDYRARANRDDVPLFGHSPDWGYFQYGAIWYGDELWGNQEYVVDYNRDGNVDDLDRLWMDDNFIGCENIFIEWTPFDHPDLGPVEIGGWNPKFWRQNGPPVLLPKAVEKQTRFNLLLAKSLPRIVIQGIDIQKNADGTSTVTATVANEGFLPDALKQAWLIKIVKQGIAKLELGEGLSLADGSAPLVQEIGFFAGAFEDENDDRFVTVGQWERVKKVSWIVKGTGEIKVTVRSTRGGTATASAGVK